MIGAYAIERDYSHYIAQATKTVLAVVGTASKGPIGEVTAITSSQDLVNKFGPLKVGCYGLYASQYFLSQSSKMYFVRAASESAKAASLNIAGVNASDGVIDEAVTVELTEKGTYGNSYTLIVSEASEGVYNIIVKNAASTTVDALKGVTLDDLTIGYTANSIKITAKDETTAAITAGNYSFSGGDDGIKDITSADYINALDKLKAESVDANLITIPGISDASVINAAITLAENRGDCFCILDTPQGLTRDGVIAWIEGGDSYDHARFNSSYGAVYYDWVNIYDSVNKQTVTVPPSVVVCATYAYSDRTADLWFAPAGLNRGIIRGALSTVTNLSKGDVDLLYASNINAIYDNPQVGLVLWGQKTLFRENTALDRVNVRRLMNYIKKVITATCDYLTYEPNDRVTWNSFEMKIIPTLESIKNRRGIYEYRVVKGSHIVTSEDIDNYRMPCMIMIRPTKAAEEIPIYFTITSTGADFNEVLDFNGIV